MPEGDTIREARRRLAPLLEGAELEAVWFRKIRGHRPRPGQRVEAVRAVGKHLLVDFDRGLTLDTHLGMSGRWRTLPAGARPPADPRLRIVLSVAGGHALCFGAPSITTHLRAGDVDDGPPGSTRHPEYPEYPDSPSSPTDRLGPDLSEPDADLDAVVRRSRRLAPPDTPAADVLLDQRLASGVGNVFANEALFVAGVHPATPLGALDDRALRRLWGTAHHQMVRNDRPGRRATTPDGRLWVYRRARAACRRCGTPIRRSAPGAATTRSCYWCPRCQPAPGAPLR